VRFLGHTGGDRWEEKEHKGPSDPPPSTGRAGARRKTFDGVDVVGNSRKQLYERARGLGVKGRSSMSKEELAEAIARRQ